MRPYASPAVRPRAPGWRTSRDAHVHPSSNEGDSRNPIAPGERGPRPAGRRLRSPPHSCPIVPAWGSRHPGPRRAEHQKKGPPWDTRWLAAFLRDQLSDSLGSAPGHISELASPRLVVGSHLTPSTKGHPARTVCGAWSVRGRLSSLRSSGGDFSIAIEGCVSDDHRSTSLPYAATPGTVGDGFFFLARGVDCDGNGTYDSGGPGQVGSRDEEIGASPNSQARGLVEAAGVEPASPQNANSVDGARLSSQPLGDSLPCCQFVVLWSAPQSWRHCGDGVLLLRACRSPGQKADPR
jgi:hypothetical protein